MVPVIYIAAFYGKTLDEFMNMSRPEQMNYIKAYYVRHNLA